MGRQDCLGATMALRRETLERIGGFAALVDHLADDNVLGRLVQGLGLTVALADTVPATTVPETTSQALWRHELRWARTIRALVPAPVRRLGPAVPAGMGGAGDPAGSAARSGRWPGSCSPGCRARWLCGASIGRSDLANRAPRVWLLPLRELMSVAVMVASYAGREVDWRGHTLSAEGTEPAMMKTLFLHPPSFDGFDGGAGSRYQARREIRSFWYPTWLAQPAALVPGSKLIDAPPARHRPRCGDARRRAITSCA